MPRVDLYGGGGGRIISGMSSSDSKEPPASGRRLAGLGRIFHSDVVDRVRASGNVWHLPGGQLMLPEVLGFCRGVERALEMVDQAVTRCAEQHRRVFLLGEIIHNPWVNDYFRLKGVKLLTLAETGLLDQYVGPDDCAIVPAFGVPLSVDGALAAIGCEIVDTSCGDVRGLWRWGEKAVAGGYGVLIFGRARHDETVVTKSRLAAAGGMYVVVGDLEQTRQLCRFITGRESGEMFGDVFGPETTNATSSAPFERLAQVSQTTMLYDETMAVHAVLAEAFAGHFGPEQSDRLLLHPTVCRATQDRQTAANNLCQRCDLAVVVGGFRSSNTRHLYELASRRVPAMLIEGADSIRSADEIESVGPADTGPTVIHNWLPPTRPLRIAVLAGASCPETVIGQVLQRLSEFLS